MPQLAKKIISFMLLAVFVLYITPKELYHVFTNHTDTHHESETLSVMKGLQISAEHHHCELLKSDQQYSACDIAIPYCDFAVMQQFYAVILQTAQKKFRCAKVYSAKQLRAPPVRVM